MTQKGNATHIWKVADVEFLYLGTKSEDCLGVKSKLVAGIYVYNKIYGNINLDCQKTSSEELILANFATLYAAVKKC